MAGSEPRDAIDPEHHRKLERLYASAPVTQWFGTAIRISDGATEVRVEVRPQFLHAAHAVHSAVYFRLLVDAAGTLLGHGLGVFVRSAIPLDAGVGYA